jgi:hypothetical protein
MYVRINLHDLVLKVQIMVQSGKKKVRRDVLKEAFSSILRTTRGLSAETRLVHLSKICNCVNLFLRPIFIELLFKSTLLDPPLIGVRLSWGQLQTTTLRWAARAPWVPFSGPIPRGVRVTVRVFYVKCS